LDIPSFEFDNVGARQLARGEVLPSDIIDSSEAIDKSQLVRTVLPPAFERVALSLSEGHFNAVP
jgi:hypothetical protein